MLTVSEADIHGTVGARLKGLASEIPDHLAVIEGDQSWTYREFLEACQAFADGFATLGNTRPVALILGQEARTLVVFYGALLAGIPVVAIDIAAPPEGLAKGLEPCALVFTTPELRETVEAMRLGLPIATNAEQITDFGKSHPQTTQAETGCDSTAVIYLTSGTTGVPKGVVTDHKRLLHTVAQRSKTQAFSEDTRQCLIRSFAFSGTIEVIFSGFLNGRTIVVADFRNLSKDSFSRLVEEHKVTELNLTPSHLRTLAGHLAERGSQWQPEKISLSGEPLFSEDLVFLRQEMGWRSRVQNRLGSSEVGVVAEWFVDDDIALEFEVVPVGHAYDSRRIEIQDENGVALPADQTGEIVVFGRYMANEYWNDPALTADRFLKVSDPGAEELYRIRTGDLGMLDENGLLHHMGRRDTQVKIRGNRVEIRSVERAIRSVPGVSNAAVVARKNASGSTYLAGYAEPSSSTALTSFDLRQELRGRLPDYAVPSKLTLVDRFPLTAGGKVNFSALPEPDRARPSGMSDYEALSGDLETRIGRIMSQTLEIDDIGRHDDFFDLGGDSIGAMTVALQLQKELAIQFDEVDLFLRPNAKEMAETISDHLG